MSALPTDVGPTTREETAFATLVRRLRESGFFRKWASYDVGGQDERN